ncbi:hypothetical protein LSCM1_04480 [Leishmania martiniquensis]|uniref:Uncharacterized protein n=1 Tax=Leishmania martiniquensis TaxID=1580590 RepID=A0A836HBU9_9TRYP|nr:hypothetical protein LSCM1_04480 [Leishmania martiniquensis]
MRGIAVAKTSPVIQPVRISFQDVHVGEMKTPHHFPITLEATRTWCYEEASVSLTHSVILHGPEEHAKQQRTPLGAHKAGVVHIMAGRRPLSPAVYDTSATSSSGIDPGSGAPIFSVPLYAARASYQRPNLYKEHCSLCIVEGPPHISARFQTPHDGGARRQSHKEALECTPEKPTDVLFIDVAALTPDPHASLRCTDTGEISTPTTLYFRCATAPSSSPTSASTKDQRRPQGRHIPWYGARDRSQQRRRRVVLLPPTAAGRVFELVSISMKRGREK